MNFVSVDGLEERVFCKALDCLYIAALVADTI
jgi:hypothetical protein